MRTCCQLFEDANASVLRVGVMVNGGGWETIFITMNEFVSYFSYSFRKAPTFLKRKDEVKKEEGWCRQIKHRTRMGKTLYK